MIILYVLLIAYIAAINFYAFLLVKSLRDKETETARTQNTLTQNITPTTAPERVTGKLCIAGLLGGAITIYTGTRTASSL